MKGGKSIFVSLMQKALSLIFHHLHPGWSVYLVFGGGENTLIFQNFYWFKWLHKVQTSGRSFSWSVASAWKRNQVAMKHVGKEMGRLGRDIAGGKRRF